MSAFLYMVWEGLGESICALLDSRIPHTDLRNSKTQDALEFVYSCRNSHSIFRIHVEALSDSMGIAES
jgi:hypothetical protein